MLEIKYLDDDPATISILARWIFEEWGHMVPGRTLETAKLKVRQSVGSTEVPLTLVAFRDGRPVGTAGIDTADMSTHPELTPWMASVYVDPALRRQGIGAALIQRIETELRRLSVETAYLFTPDQERLYARLGWRVLRREPYRGEEVAIMKLSPRD